jgi:hypothetical protein
MGGNALTNDQERTICLYKKTIRLLRTKISDRRDRGKRTRVKNSLFIFFSLKLKFFLPEIT